MCQFDLHPSKDYVISGFITPLYSNFGPQLVWHVTDKTNPALLHEIILQSSPAPDTPSERDGARSRMTSPARDYEPFEDEAGILGDNPQEEEEEDGEELFGDNMEA